VTTGGDAVALTTTLGTLGPVTDHADGTYAAVLTAGTDAGTATVTGTLGGEAIADRATVEFTADEASPNTATITADPTEIVADGVATSTITVRLFDGNGNPVTTGGDAVALTTTLGTLGPVTDHADGTYAAVLTAGTTTGTATVTGRLNGAPITDDAVVVFTDPVEQVVVIEVVPDTVTLTALGATRQFEAVARDEDGNVVPGVAFSWASDDDLVASIDTAGLATAVANGTATVAATANGVTGTATVTVRQRVSSLVLSKACPSSQGSPVILALHNSFVVPSCDTLTAVDRQLQVIAEAYDANGNPVIGATVVWTTGQPAVATVDSTGLVTAVGNGTTTITATADDAASQIEVVVRQAVSSLTVSPTDLVLAAGDQAQLTAEAFDANGYLVPDAVVAWTAIDPAVATVDSGGLVTAQAAGSTTILATAGDAGAGVSVVVQ
jgi:adhesin/invasin